MRTEEISKAHYNDINIKGYTICLSKNTMLFFCWFNC